MALPVQRIKNAARGAAESAGKTSLFLMKIMIPVSFAVCILQWLGVIPWVARSIAPAMRLVGLPGEAALVVVTSVVLNLYSAIAVIESFQFGPREITILAILCLTAHNFPVEIPVMKKSGSSALKMIMLRLTAACVLAFIFNELLPHSRSAAFQAAEQAQGAELWPVLAAWALSTLKLIIKVCLIVFAIMLAQRFAQEFYVMDFLSKGLGPCMKFFGLPHNTGFLWIVVNIVGYAYGAGIIVEQTKNGTMTQEDGDMFNHHAAMCHSLCEDTALFLAIHAPFFWITVPRLAAALLVVWLERLRRAWFKHTFIVGTA